MLGIKLEQNEKICRCYWDVAIDYSQYLNVTTRQNKTMNIYLLMI